MKKLEHDALLADREAVTRILDSMSPDDILGQMSFKSRLSDIDARLEELARSTTTHAGSVALLFGGKPVHGSRAIDANFASDILKSYQDILAKRVANDEVGRLGTRGPVPFQAAANLAITEVVRGSVGFILEEVCENETLVDTAIKAAIDDITTIVRWTSATDEGGFEQAVESLDPRLLDALKRFFTTLDDRDATIRIVDEQSDESLNEQAVRRARLRIERTEIDERDDDELVGRLLGLFPRGRRFEMELETGEVIHGAVAALISQRYDELLSDPETVPVGKTWRVKMRVRTIRERNKPDRNIYTLLGLLQMTSE